MEYKSKTIRVKDTGPVGVEYYNWIIIRGPQVLTRKDLLSHYNDAQFILCIF